METGTYFVTYSATDHSNNGFGLVRPAGITTMPSHVRTVTEGHSATVIALRYNGALIHTSDATDKGQRPSNRWRQRQPFGERAEQLLQAHCLASLVCSWRPSAHARSPSELLFLSRSFEKQQDMALVTRLAEKTQREQASCLQS